MGAHKHHLQITLSISFTFKAFISSHERQDYRLIFLFHYFIKRHDVLLGKSRLSVVLGSGSPTVGFLVITMCAHY